MVVVQVAVVVVGDTSQGNARDAMNAIGMDLIDAMEVEIDAMEVKIDAMEVEVDA